MARVALIRTATGLVENVIELEPSAKWIAPAEYEVRDATGAGPGDIWNGISFIKVPDSPPAVDRDLAAFVAGTVVQKLDILARRIGILPSI